MDETARVRNESESECAFWTCLKTFFPLMWSHKQLQLRPACTSLH